MFYVCDRCLKAIESREGKQQYVAVSYSGFEDDDCLSKCEWCGGSGFSVLYQIGGSLDIQDERR